jgi:type VI secretion system protein VasI
VRCRSGELNVYINWSSYLGLEEAPVTIRLGSAEARTESWSLSTDNQATFYPDDDAEFVAQLLATDRLVAQTTLYSESPITAVFDLTGFESTIAPLLEACPNARGK